MAGFDWRCDVCGTAGTGFQGPEAAEKSLWGHVAQCHQHKPPVPIRTDRNGLVDPSIFTDDQLRAECERRGLISGNLAIVDLTRASDTAIREEFCRRGLVDPLLKQATDRHRERIEHERDEAKRIGQLCVAQLEKTEADRDEWKCRAEAAEAKLTPGRLADAYSRLDRQERAAFRDIASLRHDSGTAVATKRPDESGPGIAAIPTEGHWVDPWDFLEDE